jgi:hypothetical protein
MITWIESGKRRIDVIEFLELAEAIGFDPTNILRQIQAAGGEPRLGALRRVKIASWALAVAFSAGGDGGRKSGAKASAGRFTQPDLWFGFLAKAGAAQKAVAPLRASRPV